MNAVLDNILTRRSVRAFKEEQIPGEDLNAILTAGSYAPNGMGMQSWKFTAVQNAAVIKKVNEAIRRTLLTIPVVPETHPYVASLIEKAKDEHADFLYHAPTYIIVTNLKDSGNAMPDSALAIGNMMLAAHSLGIGSCWLNQLPGLTHMPLIRELLTDLDVPEDHIVYGSVVMGYAAGDTSPAEPRKNVIRIIR
ncbi:nitroreductase family protein [Marasmitruncus massiliensis]|jgi:nitroreductase|uniref:nitroreductase family protein n=1 Tax=Marasmitruncus massiliensis TaxID=1944642 RepID=UPI000C7CB708|nr:nitroreductase family protein [Marasmitruncus massiliensis]MBE6905844.1 nitroreductase family protein [Oscillospiraceae bacterium]